MKSNCCIPAYNDRAELAVRLCTVWQYDKRRLAWETEERVLAMPATIWVGQCRQDFRLVHMRSSPLLSIFVSPHDYFFLSQFLVHFFLFVEYGRYLSTCESLDLWYQGWPFV